MKEQQQQQQDQQQTDFFIHNQNDIRFVYNVTPSTKQCANDCVIPFAFHYTPLANETQPDTFIMQEWLKCTKCQSFINQYCTVYGQKKLWVCCICSQNNRIPSANIPKSLLKSCCYDVTLADKTPTECIKHYMLVVDLCMVDKELQKVKQVLIEFVESKLNEQTEGMNMDTYISLITFSKFVYVYDWSCSFDSVVCFGSGKQINNYNDLAAMLGVQLNQETKILRKYGIRVKNNKDKIVNRIKKLKAQGDVQNANDHIHRKRTHRAYGQALDIATSLCELSKKQFRIINILGGPCTYGVGKVLDTSFNKQMRSIVEYQNGQNCEFKESAIAFYKYLKKKILACAVTIDLFAFCSQQTGLTQMKDLIQMSGGLLVLGQIFNDPNSIFQSSFKKAYIYDQQNDMSQSLATTAFFNVTCSPDIAINGVLGSGYPLELRKGTKYNCVSERSVGKGGTNSWYLGGLDNHKSITVVYELKNVKPFENAYYIQIKTNFTDWWGMKKTRVMTVKKLWDTNMNIIADNFDQQAAVILIARLYMFKLENQFKKNLRIWLDKLLIKWTSAFASYIKGDYQSFSLPDKMKFFPQFIYYFRRTPFFRRTGISLDQLTYQSHILNRERISNCITIIEPALLSYNVENPQPSAVRLQEEEMKGESILLLDTYFNIVLWYGEHVGYWQSEEYHKKQEYEHVRILLQAPQQDIQYLLGQRFPHPGFYRTNPGHSKQRFLKSKVSPKKGEYMQNENTLTDDCSIQEFTKALVHIIVHQKIN